MDKDMDKPTITHLGMTKGEWPVRCFEDDHKAAYWASRDDRNVVWPVLSIELGEPLRGRTIPERYELE